jgi:hypothetical protein
MSNQCPQTWPADFRDSLRWTIPTRTVWERLARVRKFIAAQLAARKIRGKASVNAAFLARQRRSFRHPGEFERFAGRYQRWWTRHLSRTRRAAVNRRWRKNH